MMFKQLPFVVKNQGMYTWHCANTRCKACNVAQLLVIMNINDVSYVAFDDQDAEHIACIYKTDFDPAERKCGIVPQVCYYRLCV